MAKGHREIKIAGVTPSGTVTDANPPIAVTVRYTFTIGDQVFFNDDAWVMAWTKEHVLVYWREDGTIHLIWLRATDVRRRAVN